MILRGVFWVARRALARSVWARAGLFRPALLERTPGSVPPTVQTEAAIVRGESYAEPCP